MSSLSHGLLPFDPLLELSAERVTGFPVSSASDFNDASTPPAMKILATASVVLGPKPKFSVMTNFPYHLWIAYLGISLLKSTSSADLCDDCSKILDEECVALQWRKDDDLLLDKLTVLNSQRPLTMVPRCDLASISKVSTFHMLRFRLRFVFAKSNERKKQRIEWTGFDASSNARVFVVGLRRISNIPESINKKIEEVFNNRVANVVFMGICEPMLENLKEVLVASQ
ncbi:hypothetical protein E3N88_11474 [Mikania micrantha]|uniref:Uncharacterized protein n=1 Tax=Mikania micrantha TaxID=192012 RepID=A0A5N6PDV0_9ASTR|nr:hypothetical protein E3N88_11474 [Mikania micrantha]